MRIRRFDRNPIITPAMQPELSENINGPSLIRVPDWLEDPLGRNYLYYADHGGKFIRLAYADRLEGPWKVHAPGTLRLDQTGFTAHIASPDVHVDDERRCIRMYFHGCRGWDDWDDRFKGQKTRVAVSDNGLAFEPVGEPIGRSYWRVFEYDGWYYTLEMPGVFRRSRDPLGPFETGPLLFTEHMRHSAVKLDDDVLTVFFSNAYDEPERILVSTIDVCGDWMAWRATEPVTALRSETDWEGAGEPLVASERGSVTGPAHQLRDPCVFREDGRDYLLYSVAGEHGIAAADILDE